MKDEAINRIAYILNQKPWIDGADVTFEDAIATGWIPLQCEFVNNVLHRMTRRFKRWESKGRETDNFILNMMANYDN